jgi:two-component system, LytTR family, response regulator
MEFKSTFMFVQIAGKGQIIKILFDDVVSIESLSNYQIIYLVQGKITVYLSLKEILEQLPKNKFCRIHKSIIINIDKIHLIEGNRISLLDKRIVVIGQAYRDMFIAVIRPYLLR